MQGFVIACETEGFKVNTWKLLIDFLSAAIFILCCSCSIGIFLPVFTKLIDLGWLRWAAVDDIVKKTIKLAVVKWVWLYPIPFWGWDTKSPLVWDRLVQLQVKEKKLVQEHCDLDQEYCDINLFLFKKSEDLKKLFPHSFFFLIFAPSSQSSLLFSFTPFHSSIQPPTLSLFCYSPPPSPSDCFFLKWKELTLSFTGASSTSFCICLTGSYQISTGKFA